MKNINLNKKIVIPIMAIILLIGMSGAGPTLPSNIHYYVPINITNSQSAATGTGFQQLLTINMSKYDSVVVGKLNNTAFYYSNGTLINSWIESNNTNTSKITNIWIKLNPSILANSNLTVFLGIANTTTNLLSSTTTGVAPQLTSTYAQYDNGANVFSNYQNFAGTTLWSGLSPISTLTLSQDNGLQITTTTTSQSYAVMTNWDIASPNIFEGLVTAQNAGGATNYQEGLMFDTGTSTSYTGTPSTTNVNYLGRCLAGSQIGTSSLCMILYEDTSLVSNNLSEFTFPYTSVESFQQSSTGVSFFDNGYTQTASTTTLSSGYVGIYLFSNVAANHEFIQWLRTRDYPPAGIMPTVAYGSLTAISPTDTVAISITPTTALYHQNVTVVATCNAGVTCEVQSPLGTTLTSGTTTATYTTSSLSLGTHTFYAYNVAGSIDTSKNVDVVTYILSKYPTLTANVYETQNEWFNYTINITKYATYGNVIIQNSIDNVTYKNESVAANQQNYNISYTIPLTQINNTKNIYNSSLILTLSNGTKEYYKNIYNNSQYTYFNYIPSPAILHNNIIEGSNQTIFLNITQKKALNLASVNSSVTIGNKTLSEFISGKYSYYVSIYSFLNKNFNLTMPKVGTPITVTATIPIKLIYNNAFVWRNTTQAFNTYLPSLVNCNATTPHAINWTFYNASNPSQLWTANVILKGSFIIKNQLYTSNTINGTNAGFTNTATSNHYSSCIYPSFAKFISGGGFRYSSTDASNATFFLQNLTTSNITQTEKLYLYNISTPILYDVAVENVTTASYIPALVQVDLYNANTNTSILVNEFYTQGGSGTYTNLQNNEEYRFIAYTKNTDNLLAVTNYFVVQSCGSSACPFVIQVGNFSISLIQSTLANLKYSCLPTPLTGNSESVSCNFVSNLGTEYNISLSVYNQSGFTLTNKVPICQKSIMTKSGTLSCTVNNINDTIYTWQFGIPINGTKYIDQGTFGTATGLLGVSGIFVVFLGLILIITLYVTKNPTIVILIADVYLTSMFYLQIIQGSIMTVGFLWIASAFIIYMINRR